MKATASSGIGTSPIYHALRSGVGGQVDSKSNDNNVTMAAGSPVRSPTNESAPNRSAFSKVSTHGVAVPMAKAIDPIAPQQGTEVFAVHVLHGNVSAPGRQLPVSILNFFASIWCTLKLTQLALVFLPHHSGSRPESLSGHRAPLCLP